MHVNDKQWQAHVNATIYGADFPRFMAWENHLSHLAIAEKPGISLGDVKRLKKKVLRS